MTRTVIFVCPRGALTFGGPVPLVGYMHRDLVVAREWMAEDEYKLALSG